MPPSTWTGASTSRILTETSTLAFDSTQKEPCTGSGNASRRNVPAPGTSTSRLMTTRPFLNKPTEMILLLTTSSWATAGDATVRAIRHESHLVRISEPPKGLKLWQD